jgi:hypothetical protein
VRVGRDFLGRASGGVFLEKGFTPRAAVTLSHSLLLLRPFASEPSAPLCIRALLLSTAIAAMASLVHPERFQSEGTLNLVRNLLGWSAPAFVERICASATALGDLAAGEFMLFVSYLSCGLVLPISPFFLLLLEELGLQLQHLTPLHPPGSHLRSPMRDVRGGGTVYLPLPPFLRAGEVREGQGPSQRLLLPDKAGFGRRLHLLPRWHEVGKLVRRLGDRQHRGQRPPRAPERRAKARPKAMEGQVIAGAGV